MSFQDTYLLGKVTRCEEEAKCGFCGLPIRRGDECVVFSGIVVFLPVRFCVHRECAPRLAAQLVSLTIKGASS